MLPMGTIMAASMLLGVVTATDMPGIRLIKQLPAIILKISALLVLASGLWNVLWYGAQHSGEFWGIAALVSGLLMISVACYNLIPEKLSPLFLKIKPLLIFALLLCSLLYGMTIYQM